MGKKKRWSPEELLQRADLLTYFLMQHDRVIGVALTGSLARVERTIRDIDLVVFHDDVLMDGTCQDPPEELGIYDGMTAVDLLEFLEDAGLCHRLSQARANTPVDYVFVHERVLWDCQYLQSLDGHATHPEFYRTVLCQIPLFLLESAGVRGGIRELVEKDERLRYPPLYEKLSRLGHWEAVPVRPIRHRCENPACQPKRSWAQIRRELKQLSGDLPF